MLHAPARSAVLSLLCLPLALTGVVGLSAPALALPAADVPRSTPEPVAGRPVVAAASSALLPARIFAAPVPGKPQSTASSLLLTRNPGNNAEAAFTTPADPCAAPACREVSVTVPAGSGQTLYARAAWTNARQFVHAWGVSPSGTVVGAQNTRAAIDKAVGNADAAPLAEFTVADPEPGVWRIQYRAVFGVDIPVRTSVALAKGRALVFPRLDVQELADRYLTQRLTYNIVFVNRRWTKQEIATFRDAMPTQYQPAVLTKQGPDGCGNQTGLEDTVVNWATVGFCGSKPYFEPVKYTIDYRFLEADTTWTADLFAAMQKVTTKDQPFSVLPGAGSSRQTQGDYVSSYDASRGKANRGPSAVVSNPSLGDSVDAFKTEDWIFGSRTTPKYARSFTDLATGKRVSSAFITPDKAGYFDPFYTKKGFKDLDRAPQGPDTSMSFFVLDTFNGELAAKYFRPNAYHYFDVSKNMIDPDTGDADGPNYSRVWGGRYRFFMHDLGAGPNNFETSDGFLSRVPSGSADAPDGDPPVWDYDNDPQWQGQLAARTARDAKAMLLSRLLGSYLYRPVPADVYFLANNNWVDCYSNPECSPDGISYTDLHKSFKSAYVEKNLAAALPGTTFTTERSNPKLKTFRYLGCAKDRAIANPDPNTAGLQPAGGPSATPPYVIVPDPNCVGKKSDPYQEALEFAKSRGDIVAGGVNDATVNTETFRAFVEANRAGIAPQPPGQFTLTNVSVVFPGASTWALPAIVGGIALGTPNNEAWGILNNLNDRFKGTSGTVCAKSKPFAPGCNGVPALSGSNGFSYTVQHEASHFLGLLHPHNIVTVDKDAKGKWTQYGQQQSWYTSFSMAPTTYAGAFSPYGVNDQDIIQRGQTAEYLRQVQDYLGDAYLTDGMAGSTRPSDLTERKVAESAKWRGVATAAFGCGDYLHAQRAMRNASLTAQGTFGPVVEPRQLKPGEQVLLQVNRQTAYAVDGSVSCAGTVSNADAILPSVTPPAGGPTALPDGVPATLPAGLALLALLVVLGRRRGVAFGARRLRGGMVAA
ncbi:MAG: hypothetical protein H7323_06115 [Frankiales bacterium]|nr:hypothetical protein [Frankiales bacterium]